MADSFEITINGGDSIIVDSMPEVLAYLSEKVVIKHNTTEKVRLVDILI